MELFSLYNGFESIQRHFIVQPTNTTTLRTLYPLGFLLLRIFGDMLYVDSRNFNDIGQMDPAKFSNMVQVNPRQLINMALVNPKNDSYMTEALPFLQLHFG